MLCSLSKVGTNRRLSILSTQEANPALIPDAGWVLRSKRTTDVRWLDGEGGYHTNRSEASVRISRESGVSLAYQGQRVPGMALVRF